MHQITIWTLESDYDCKAVQYLAEKLVQHLQLQDVNLRVIGKGAIPKRLRGENDPAKALKRAVELYLSEDRCVVFVIDTDGPMARYERAQQPNSLMNQINRLINDNELVERVHLAHAVREIEAWLLVDCIGICCYFAKKRFQEECRMRIQNSQDFSKLIRKYQKGDTESIVEAEAGGTGVKEYLVKFSEEILYILNPNLKHKDIKDKRYTESMSPEIASHIEINIQTLKRNSSLHHLGKLLKDCVVQ